MKLRNSFQRFAILGVVLAAYLPNFLAYFQQDEWIAFGNAYAKGSFSFVNLFSTAFAANVGHYVPLHHFIFGLLFKVIGQNFSYWLFISIFWHLAITYLVGLLFFKFFKNQIYATFGMALFGLSSATQQATSWVVADINTHGSSFFGLLALLLFIHAVNSEKIKQKWIYASFALTIISLFFKEATIGLFLTVPSIYFFYSKNNLQTWRKTITSNFLWCIGGGLYMIARIIMLLLPSSQNSAPLVTATQSMTEIFYNVVTFPAKAFFQAFLPAEFWLKIGRFIGRVLPHRWEINTSQFSVSVNEKILEPLFILGFIAVCIFTIRRYLRLKTFETKIMLWALFFVIFNSVIYAFSPERTGIITFIDSRNLYFTSIGSFLWIVALLYRRFENKNILAVFFVFAFVLVQVFFLETEFFKLVEIGMLRKTIIAQIHKKVPYLTNNSVFFVISDTPYYGLSEEHKTPPFQSGFGHTLLVTYSEQKLFSAKFYSDSFLWPLGSQNYLSDGGQAFGYFSEYSALIAAMRQYKISTEDVYAFSWQGGTESLLDITEQTRTTIKSQNAL